MRKIHWIALSTFIIALIAEMPTMLNHMLYFPTDFGFFDLYMLFVLLNIMREIGIICIPLATTYKNKTSCIISCAFLIVGQISDIVLYHYIGEPLPLEFFLNLLSYTVFGTLVIIWLFRQYKFNLLYIPCGALLVLMIFCYFRNIASGTTISLPPYILEPIVLILSVYLLGNERPNFGEAKRNIAEKIKEKQKSISDNSLSNFTYLDEYLKNKKK